MNCALNTQKDYDTKAQGFSGIPRGEAVSSLNYSRERRGVQEREQRVRRCWAAQMLLTGNKEELKQETEHHHLPLVQLSHFLQIGHGQFCGDLSTFGFTSPHPSLQCSVPCRPLAGLWMVESSASSTSTYFPAIYRLYAKTWKNHNQLCG